MKNTRKIDTKSVVGVAIFSALALVVALVCNIIPPVAGFLSLDFKDAVISIASFIYGPISAITISFLSAFIELITFSTTGWYGFVMNFVSSAVFSLTASLIYKKKRDANGALIGFFSAVVLTTSTMLLLNLFVTPLYLRYIGVPIEAATVQVRQMLATTLLPFNFAKALMNSSIAMLLYKPLVKALRLTKLSSPTTVTGYKASFNKNSIIFLSVGAITLAIAIAIILLIK